MRENCVLRRRWRSIRRPAPAAFFDNRNVQASWVTVAAGEVRICLEKSRQTRQWVHASGASKPLCSNHLEALRVNSVRRGFFPQPFSGEPVLHPAKRLPTERESAKTVRCVRFASGFVSQNRPSLHTGDVHPGISRAFRVTGCALVAIIIPCGELPRFFSLLFCWPPLRCRRWRRIIASAS